MTITVTVKPNSRQTPRVVQTAPDTYEVYLREKAHGGEANAALIKHLAQHFGVPKTTITILRGATSRRKLIELL